MSNCVDDTIGGFNTFMKNQPPDTTISLTLFDNEIETLYTQLVKDVPLLDTKTFVPRGSTALFDSIGHVIKMVPIDEVKPTIVILTDGFENSSTKYTKFHISDLITEKKKLGWEFVFLAANQDAIQAASDIGISESSAMTFSTETVADAFKGVSQAISRNRTGETQGVEFSPLERASSIGIKKNSTI
jgi:hypothetical protein